MKKITTIILMGGLLLFTSCENFLDVTPLSEYTDKTFYQTPEDFEMAITACYTELQGIFGKGNEGYMNTIIYRSDEVRNSNNISRFNDGSTEVGWKNSWQNLWRIVYCCNKVLDRIDAVEFPADLAARKNYIKGEALAMRGFAYLQFAWCWGGVPLITTELSLADTYKLPRSTQEETYAQSENDFKAAYHLLPETWNSEDLGRVTKYAASGMLGRLYMYTHEYDSAKVYLEQVIAQENTLYKLETNYDDCFDDAKNNSPERVWEVQYMGGVQGQALGLSQEFSSWFIPSSLNVRQDGPLMNGITFSGSSGSVRASQSLFDPSVYETGDKRRDLTLVTGLTLDKTAPVMDQYFCKKFLKSTGTKPTGIDFWGNNLPILRYTDVKLMYAEALNELDYAANITTILAIINEVRDRAGLAHLSAADLPDQDAVQEYLIHERFVEFCFEGLRWPDLIRWGRAEEAMQAHFAYVDEGFDSSTNQPMYSMKEYNLLAPIPYSEIVNYNNEQVMWQNPGY